MWRWFGIILIILLATVVRLHEIDAQSLWHDEGNSLRLAERNVPDLIEATGRDIHAPGYYLGLKMWITVTGTSEFSLRTFSALMSILSVAVSFALGKQLSGRAMVGCWAALIVSLHPFSVYYAQETRMYAQLGAMSIISLWLLLIYLKSQRWQLAVMLSVVNAIGLYTHYTFPITMVVQSVFFLWWWLPQRDNFKLIRNYTFLNIFSLLLFLPWLPTAYHQVTTWPSTGDTTALSTRLDRIFQILFYGQSVPSISNFYYILGIGLVLLGLMLQWRKWGQQFLIPSLLIVLSIGLLLSSGAYREANLKFLIPAQAATAILLAYGLVQVHGLIATRFPKQSLIGFTVMLGVLAVLVQPTIQGLHTIFTDDAYARSNYRGVVARIQSLARDSSAVILNAPNQEEVFSYYFTDNNISVYPLPRGLGGNDPETAMLTQEVIDNHNRIFLVLWGQQERDPNSVVQFTLDNNAFVIERKWFNDVELVQYAVLGATPTMPDIEVNMRFGEQITLVGYSLSGQQFVAGQGDALGVTLFWETNSDITDRYKISVQVLAPNGTLADQHDSEPANGLRPTISWQVGEVIADNHGLILNTALPAGTYTLNVVVYDANNPDRRLTPENGNPNAILELAQLDIIP